MKFYMDGFTAMGSVDEMKTFEARLATFDIVHSAPKRTSVVKGAKSIAWPHSRPSPAELAHAGFYYNPSPESPDNASCFLCGRGLDGWEEEDNPTEEHLTHSSECGWAIMTSVSQHSSNPAEIEDPTSSKMVEARRSTFMSSWPHDGKRGWVCKTEKLVAAGWYFCPTEESEDFVSCAYCKLSLDGWEPKDNPYDEHYRRSSDCSFFAFASAPGKKATRQSRAKKPRASKASRLSTQSNVTAVSEAGTADIDDTMDHSTISQSTTKSKATKKPTKSKAKGSRAKKAETIDTGSQMDVESNDGGPDENPRPKRAARGKKRTSDEMEEEDEPLRTMRDGSVKPEPPTKKKTKTTRNTATKKSINSDEIESLETTLPRDFAHKTESSARGGNQEQSLSTARKSSAESTASKASLRSRVPDDAEIEAALEADLDGGMTDDEVDVIPEETRGPGRKSKKSKPSSASVAPVRATKRSKNEDKTHEITERTQSISDDEFEDATSRAGSRQAPAKRKVATKKPSRLEEGASKQNLESSMISVEIRADDSGHEADAGASRPPLKKGGKKKGAPRKGKKTGADQSSAKETKPQAPLESANSEYVEPSKTENEDEPFAEDPMEVKIDDRQVDVIEPKPILKAPKIASERIERDEERQPSSRLQSSGHNERENRHTVQRTEPSVITISSPAPMQKHTPSPSPQSSDAENQPPSARPSANRPPVLSPSKKLNFLVPLAASTPSASPSKRNANRLNTAYPWSPADIEEIFLAGSLDKENINLSSVLNEAKGGLDSPQKKMTVEEWILWNSKNGEEKLRRECERLIGIFEKEGGRAMMTLDGIECIE